MSEQLATQIEQFIGHVGKYFQWEQVYGLRCDNLATRDETIGHAIIDGLAVEVVDAQHQRAVEAANIRRVGTTLAQAFDAAGHDSTGVLRVVHCADGGGGVAALAPLWAEIKVGLQRVAMTIRTRESTKRKAPARILVVDHIVKRMKGGAKLTDFTRDGIAEAVGLSHGAVSRTEAWRLLASQKRGLSSDPIAAAIRAQETGDWSAFASLQRREQQKLRQHTA